MHKDASVFNRASPHGGKSPQLKRSPFQGEKKVSDQGERFQDFLPCKIFGFAVCRGADVAFCRYAVWTWPYAVVIGCIRYSYVDVSRHASVVLIVSGSYFDAVGESYDIVLCVHSTGLESVLWERSPECHGVGSSGDRSVDRCRLVHAFLS